MSVLLLYDLVEVFFVIQGGGIISRSKSALFLLSGKIQRMLDLVPASIHDRCPVILGSPRDVELVLSQYKK